MKLKKLLSTTALILAATRFAASCSSPSGTDTTDSANGTTAANTSSRVFDRLFF